jgi:hypothetical protein
VWDNYGPETTLVGRGAFARVYKSNCKLTGKAVAIKVIGRESAGFNQQRRGEGRGQGKQQRHARGCVG